ncbi:MAG: SRPBCC family protein [Deltaproteobacteria bacterium]|nr:SRPBCC family protein [Deltaproteobacteria bacterium]
MTTALEPVRRSQTFVGVQPRSVFDVVADFESYPRFFKEIQGAKVVSRQGSVVRADFKVPLMLPVRYVLDLKCDPESLAISWTFVEGDIVTNNEGAWRFAAAGADTRVDYEVSLAVKAPVPGFVLRKITDSLVSASLPGMFKALEAEVRRRKG